MPPETQTPETPSDPTQSAEAMLSQVDRQEAEEQLQRDGIDIANDADFADWFANKVNGLDEEEARINLQHEIRVRQVQSRRQSLAAHFLPKVSEAVGRLVATGKKKSIDLPSGALGFRATQTTATYDTIERVKAFAESYPPAALAYAEETEIVQKVSAGELKNAIEKYASEHAGEIPEGLGLIGGGDKFYVKAPKSKE